MTAKPPVLMAVRAPALWCLDRLSDDFDLRSEPAPGIAAIVTGSGGPSPDVLAALPDLRLVAVCAVGYEGVDVAALHARGIAVTNTPDVLTDDVADLALALMLSVARRIPQNDAYVRAGEWPRRGAPALASRLSGRRIGILGLGRIGRAIAHRAAAFGGPIAYSGRREQPDVPYRYIASPRDLARWAEVLVVATPGDASTARLVDAGVIDALGPQGVLVNIARGSVVDEAALVAALVEGRLGGAGLDVFVDEPHVPEALLTLETVVLLPHQGSATRETRGAMADLVRDNLHAFFAGCPLVTPVTA